MRRLSSALSENQITALLIMLRWQRKYPRKLMPCPGPKMNTAYSLEERGLCDVQYRWNGYQVRLTPLGRQFAEGLER